ncbi:hypothetical protein KM043_013828 [Ampulex compressa]|nr:hypothetical protein KM043_013828 [Ampulex compressa]
MAFNIVPLIIQARAPFSVYLPNFYSALLALPKKALLDTLCHVGREKPPPAWLPNRAEILGCKLFAAVITGARSRKEKSVKREDKEEEGKGPKDRRSAELSRVSVEPRADGKPKRRAYNGEETALPGGDEFLIAPMLLQIQCQGNGREYAGRTTELVQSCLTRTNFNGTAHTGEKGRPGLRPRDPN